MSRCSSAAGLAALLLGGCQSAGGSVTGEPGWAARLKSAYPDHIVSIDAHEIVMRDGARLPVSDGISGKTNAQRLAKPDLDDMFAQPYVAGRTAPPSPGDDPGRARYEPFFDHVYGDCRLKQVERHMRNVAWMPGRGGGTVRVTTVNHVAEQLEAVVRDLERLPPEMTRYLVPSAGTYNCRYIDGTTQRSMHAYGIAIDISTKQADYWRWSGGEGARYRNRIPFEIVSIFEKHGFIWGGKWSHFDTMHFEYRPELLPAR